MQIRDPHTHTHTQAHTQHTHTHTHSINQSQNSYTQKDVLPQIFIMNIFEK